MALFAGGQSCVPVTLRAHHVLCLQGFRGKGYSREFAANLAAIAEKLGMNPSTEVMLIGGVDDICGPCPHRRGDWCSKGRTSGGDPDLMDLKVLRKLGFSEGERTSWLDILLAIKNRLRCEELEEICDGCQWFAEGHCIEGLKNLLQVPSIRF